MLVVRSRHTVGVSAWQRDLFTPPCTRCGDEASHVHMEAGTCQPRSTCGRQLSQERLKVGGLPQGKLQRKEGFIVTAAQRWAREVAGTLGRP